MSGAALRGNTRMSTNNDRQTTHDLIDRIFHDLLPAQGMAERREQTALSHWMLDALPTFAKMMKHRKLQMRRKPRQFPVFYYNDMFLTGTGGANKALNNQREGFAMQNEDFYEALDIRKQEQLPIVLTPAEAMDVLG